MPDKDEIGSTRLRALTAASKRLHDRYDNSIETALYCAMPFYGDVLVLVLSDTLTSLVEVIETATLGLPRWIKVFAVHKHEVHTLAWVHPQQPELYVLPYWLRFESRVMLGTDIRETIPLPTLTGDIIKVHLAYSLYRLRARILDALRLGEHVMLITELAEQRFAWMMTALLSKGFWRVTPQTVLVTFGRYYTAVEVRFNMEAFAATSITFEDDALSTNSKALHATLLTERFAAMLWSAS